MDFDLFPLFSISSVEKKNAVNESQQAFKAKIASTLLHEKKRGSKVTLEREN